MSNPAHRGPRPKGVTLNRETHSLHIDWHDGHSSDYPLDALREACPCAVCRGGHEFMGPEHDPDLIELKPARTHEALDIQLVGSYALQIMWSDGHNAGIYAWEYLRRLCPCDQCRQERGHSG